MSFELKPATRQGVKPLIGLFSESGCGKTLSSLLLARGLAGPDGKIAQVDTESGRGALYADVVPGGYMHMELREPFTPSRYIQAIQTVEQSGAVLGLLDSGSHEWEGLGGVLDQASEIEERTKKPGLHCWRLPKMEHAKFMLRLLQSPIPWVVCLRAKYKSRQTKVEGKTQIIKDDHTTPIQAEDFIFEMTAHAEINPDHSIRLTKCSHPDLRKCFPTQGPITIETGKAIAQWCAGATKAPGAPAPSSIAQVPELKKKLWTLTASVHGGSQEAFSKWLHENKLIGDHEDPAILPAIRLATIIDQTKVILSLP